VFQIPNKEFEKEPGLCKDGVWAVFVFLGTGLFAGLFGFFFF
jgi:hypothetical protein